MVTNNKFISTSLTIKIMEVFPKDVPDNVKRYKSYYYKDSSRRKNVEKYKKEIMDGNWISAENMISENQKHLKKLKGFPIVFLKNGNVFEGKHRCIALLELENVLTDPISFACIVGWDRCNFGGIKSKEYVDFICDSIEKLYNNDFRETILNIQ